MPFLIQPFFRKPFKLFAIDADAGQPLDPNVRKKTRVSYYELQNGSNGSKRLMAHKTPSQVAKQGDNRAEEPQKTAGEPKKDEGEHGDDAPWTAEQDKVLKAMKEDGKSWAQIVQEVGHSKSQCQARWKEINSAQGKKEDAGKKDGGGDGGDQAKQGGENKDGNNQNQGQGKKNKKGGNNQNHNQNHNNNQSNDKNDNNNKNNHQNKKGNKPTPKPSSNNDNIPNEARFTMNDWLTLQGDDIFSFGELQCLSELIAKDMNQSWHRVAAKFFDLTGRRVHPDDVREKFESMAVVAEGKK
jgi:hypothetical protein